MQIAYEVALQMVTDKYAFSSGGCVRIAVCRGAKHWHYLLSTKRARAVVAAAAAIPQHHFDFAVQQDRQKSHCLPTPHACKDACDVELR